MVFVFTAKRNLHLLPFGDDCDDEEDWENADREQD
jgi:hypothetical protein